MKKFSLLGMLGGAALVLAGVPGTANAIQINFAAHPSQSGAVAFDGASDSFYFVPAVHQFQITSVLGGSGDSVGMSGNITASFLIGAVTVNGGIQTAPVSGAGTLTINDGVTTLSAALVWGTISSFGIGGTMNHAGILNLSDISYGGSHADLIALAAPGVGTAVVTFEFNQETSLIQLKDFGGQTSFMGSFNSYREDIDPPQVPDGGLTLALLGLALAGVESIRRRIQS